MVESRPCGALFWLFLNTTPPVIIVKKTRIVGCGRGEQPKMHFLGGKKPAKNDFFSNHILGCIGVNIITRARGGVWRPFLGFLGVWAGGRKTGFLGARSELCDERLVSYTANEVVSAPQPPSNLFDS